MSIDIILQPLKEMILYDIPESIYYLFMFLALYRMLHTFKAVNNIIKMKKIYINSKKAIFHIIMLGIINYIICNTINVGGWMQLVLAIGIAFYCSIMFKLNIIESCIISIFSFFVLFFNIEIGMAYIYQHIFNINLITMTNDVIKSLFMIPFRVVEYLLTYIVYKFLGGEIHYEKDNCSYIK